MEMRKLKSQFTAIIQKYKYVLLVALIGIVLMLLPSSGESKEEVKQTEKNAYVQSSTQDDLENILSQIEGAGAVRVMLRERNGAETIYQTDEDGSKTQTVIITDSGRNENGLVKQINPPQYIGAVVLCQGAENPAVKFAVADAVSKVTGLGLDKIAVLKMK